MLNLSLEIIAVITAILYLVLAAKEDVKCWYAAIISSSLYFYIMLNAGLLMEAILQVFYVGMAIYGWKTSYYQNTNDLKSDEVEEEKSDLNNLLNELEQAEEGECESCAV